MSNSIVILSGSPRIDGNTDKLVAAFIEGAESAGKSVTVFKVADMKIGGCLGCRYCFEEKGVCVQKDDMPQILDAIRNAGTLILASPIYFFTITAQLKLAIDRTYPLLIESPHPVRRAALLTTYGKGVNAEEGAEKMFNNICYHLKWDNAGSVHIGGLRGKDDIVGREELEKAKALGREI